MSWIETTKDKKLIWRLRFRYFEEKIDEHIFCHRVTRNWFKPIERIVNWAMNKIIVIYEKLAREYCQDRNPHCVKGWSNVLCFFRKIRGQ